MSITTVTIDSLADLIAKVTPTSPDPVSGRHRDSGVYRGAADASWPLLTSLDTLGGVSPRPRESRSGGAHPPQLHPLLPAVLPGRRPSTTGRS